ncbi:MAG TPA: acyltransferase family protein [Terracidiphilus sp.]|nr:acyltransferase family protein [Terracidiphilus sp.]
MQSNAVTVDRQPTANAAKPRRIAALDFTKGLLVLFMVFYHWANYFIGSEWPYYRYLRFLTPSFIFITGFMVSHIYLSKYDVAAPQLLKRLVVRGLKLVAIFLVLNLGRDCLLPLLTKGKADFSLLQPQNLQAIFISGESTSKPVSFYILIPIALLLILSGILMIPQRRFKYSFHAFCLFLFVSLGALELAGVKNQNLEIIAIGMLGVLAGFTRIETINRVVRHPYLLALAYLVYTIAIAIWNVPYPLEIVGTCLTVAIIYLLGTVDWKFSSIQDIVILLGKYSLFGYIAQIVILQILAAGFHRFVPKVAVLPTSFVAAFALTVMSIQLLDRARARASSVNWAYKAVFN